MDDLENLIQKVEAMNQVELNARERSLLEIGLEEGFNLTDDLVADLDVYTNRLQSEITILKAIKLN